MITIIARKHLRYDTQGNDIARVYISVSSSSELPAQDGIPKIIIAEASKAWDVSTGNRYGFVVGQGWKKQATVINPMTLKGRVDSIEDLPENAEPGWVYFVGDPEEDNLPEYMYTEDGKWDPIGTNSIQIDIDASLSTTSENPVQNKVITNALNSKVNTETGKGLSTNDYTTAEKTKLAGLSNYDDTEVRGLIATKADASILTPISESAYEALVTKDKPLYFIYD